MNLQQNFPARVSVNGHFGEQERRGQSESKMQFGKSHSNINALTGTRGTVIESPSSPSRDRLIYVSACLIGLNVEVHVKNGYIYTGIFHSTNTEKDFGIILKMARVIGEGSKEQKHTSSNAKRPQTIIIPSRELVQIIAKDVPLTGDEFSNGNSRDKRQDLMIDSAISYPHFTEERELERWTPDDDDLHYHGLDDIFDGSHNRKWDQFETNAVLFGVKSTFNEELYTTKLERGPQTKELEKEALRIAKEIEGEETYDLHLAEERGIDLNEDFDLDEETRFSAVYRGPDHDPRNGSENMQLGFCSDKNVGQMFDTSAGKQLSDVSGRKYCESGDALVTASTTDGTSKLFDGMSAHDSTINHWDSVPTSAGVVMDNHPSTDESRILKGSDSGGENNLDEHIEKMVLNETQLPTGTRTLLVSSKSYSEKDNLPLDDATCPVVQENKDSLIESSISAGIPVSTQPFGSNSRPGSSRSSSSDNFGGSPASSGPGFSPNSFVGSLTCEKSKLNPCAKEFKLNPNAKSFTPSSSLRPHSPVSEGSFYYATNVPAVSHIPGLPVGVGVAPPYGVNQSVVYNPHSVQMQAPQAYMHPGGLYGQQMYFAQPRPVLYMPPYSPEMPYKGREF